MRLRDQNDFIRSVQDHEQRALVWGEEMFRNNSSFLPEKVERFVDVGANVGGFSLCVLKRSPGAEAHLFEPSRHLANACGQRFGQYPNVHIHNCALADYEGTSKLWQNINNIGGASLADDLHGEIPLDTFLDTHVGAYEELQAAPIDVPVMRLDSVVHDKVDILKIDTEGAEFMVLGGAMGLIAASRPVIFLEVSYGRNRHPQWTRERAAIQAVCDLGYNIFAGTNLINSIDHDLFAEQQDVVLNPK